MKMLVIGLDGATLDLVQPWVEAGYLPNLRRLMVEGAWGRLESTLPPITAAAWASFMTGKNPAGHGVFDFFRGGVTEFVDSRSITGPTLWALLSQAGLSAGVLNVPITHPPEAITGFLVPGLLSPDQGATTHPPGLLEPYYAELGPYRLTPHIRYRPGNESAFIADLHDVLATQLRYALRLALDHPTDLLMVHFLVTDIAQHALWRFLDAAHPWFEPRLAARYGSAVRDLFAAVDDGIGQLWGLLPADSTVIALSDHGFGPLHYLVNLNLFFADRGLLAIKPEARLRYRLCRNRLSRPFAWRLARLWGQATGTSRKLIDFDDIDWSHTRAYARGHLGQVYVNLQGREPGGIVAPTSYLAERQQVAEALLTLRNPARGEQVVTAVIPREEAGYGPCQDNGPDLHVIFSEAAVAYPLFAADGQVLSEQRHGNSGEHRRHGLVIMAGPGIRAGTVIEDAAIVDLAPTILSLFGLPIPAEMDGRVMAQALQSTASGDAYSADATEMDGRVMAQALQRTASGDAYSADAAVRGSMSGDDICAEMNRPGAGALTAAEQMAIEKQLRSLGYLG